MFDLAIDPNESHNLAPEKPVLVANMRERLRRILTTAIQPLTGDNVLEGNPYRNGGIVGPGWCNLPNLS